LETLNVEFAITGTKHHDYAKVWDQLQLDDPVTLLADPTNAYDEYATKVMWQGHQLGWVPQKSGFSKIVAEAMRTDLNIDAEISELSPDSSWRQVKIWIRSDNVSRDIILKQEYGLDAGESNDATLDT